MYVCGFVIYFSSALFVSTYPTHEAESMEIRIRRVCLSFIGRFESSLPLLLMFVGCLLENGLLQSILCHQAQYPGRFGSKLKELTDHNMLRSLI